MSDGWVCLDPPLIVQVTAMPRYKKKSAHGFGVLIKQAASINHDGCMVSAQRCCGFGQEAWLPNCDAAVAPNVL